MFTSFVHMVLRTMAGAAFTAASAVLFWGAVYVAPVAPRIVAAPNSWVIPEHIEHPIRPDVQAFTAPPGPAPRVSTPDPVKVVMPPPTPTPTPTLHKAVAPKPRKTAPSHYRTPVGVAQGYAASKVSGSNFTCLVDLWNRESSWNTHAENASSGAYGIPQSLPGDKMALFGSDWRDNYKTQINWGLSYINAVYGSACAAWQHSESVGWY